ncbi:MAG: oligosaccharide flippase family protein [Candidatus Daviesbacteria bacterium]|nr:oligosaccharide flippase family protein [Candidatus Daviesbacteria bacterium]
MFLTTNFKKAMENKFITSSLVMIIGTNFYNLSQFIFHFLTGRFLGKVVYGDLAALISILGFIGIFQSSFGLTIVKFIASADEKEIPSFIRWVYWWSIRIGLVIGILLLVLSPILGSFLNITQPVVAYMLVPLITFFVLVSTMRSVLQGLTKFDKFVVNLLIEAGIKIILTLVFMLLGFAIFGAIAAYIIGVLVAFLLVRISLSNYLKGKGEKGPELRKLINYSSATFIQGLALTSMYSTDLFLVKHFFNGEQAGIYASLAILGRIVFFGSTPIIHVMFPMVARKHHLNENYYKIFFLSAFMVGFISIALTVFYFFFPNLAILALYGPSFLEGAYLLWWFGIFMTLLAVVMLLTQFFLSVGKLKVVYLFISGAILQAILIWFYHRTLLEVIQMSIISAALLVFVLFVYFVYQKFHK